MTLVAAWTSIETPAQTHATIISDSLASINGQTFIGLVPKVLPLQIRVCREGTDDFLNRPYYEHSVGVAFAGNVTVAHTVYILLKFVASRLQSETDQVPQLHDIARLAARIASRCFRDAADNQQVIRSGFDMLIVGWCHASNGIRAARIQEPAESGQCNAAPVALGSIHEPLLLGAAVDSVRERLNEQKRTSKPNYERVFHLLCEICEGRIQSELGGGLQWGRAYKSGFATYARATIGGSSLPAVSWGPFSKMDDLFLLKAVSVFRRPY